jgi:cell division protein FtsZ
MAEKENRMIEFSDIEDRMSSGGATVKVIGVGGAGGNAINTMMQAGLKEVEFIAINTDMQDLQKCKAPEKVQIGKDITKGLGAGSNPQIGMQAANEDRGRLEEIIAGADVTFIAAGLGGGTGTGASPVIAEICKKFGTLTIAVVTKPFEFEGKVRAAQAESGVKELRKAVDALITIPNQKLLNVVDTCTSLVCGFGMANKILHQAVQSISDLVTGVGYINVDFADVRTIMAETGNAVMGIGVESGKDRAQRATEKAMSCPLLEATSIYGARAVLVNISGSTDLAMHEIDEVMAPIHSALPIDAPIVLGIVIDDSLNGALRVTVIATGLDASRSIMDAALRTRGRNMDTILRKGSGEPNIIGKKLPQTRELLTEFDTPAFQRRKEQSLGEHKQDERLSSAMPEAELDIPSFLRSRREE